MIVKDEDFKRILPIHSSLRVYPVLYDTSDKERFLDIFRSYIRDTDLDDYSLYLEHIIQEEDWLDLISYKYYGTPYLWWLVATVNGITNPYEALEPGLSVRVLRKEYLFLAYDSLYEIERL